MLKVEFRWTVSLTGILQSGCGCLPKGHLWVVGGGMLSHNLPHKSPILHIIDVTDALTTGTLALHRQCTASYRPLLGWNTQTSGGSIHVSFCTKMCP